MLRNRTRSALAWVGEGSGTDGLNESARGLSEDMTVLVEVGWSLAVGFDSVIDYVKEDQISAQRLSHRL